VESGDVDFTLTNTSLTFGTHTDTLSGISRATLNGGSSANVIDASAFTLGPVVLNSGGGLDTLKGGAAGNNQFLIDVTGLTKPTSATDTADQVAVDPGGGTGNTVIIQGFDPSDVTQTDLDWVHYPSAPATNYPPTPYNSQADIAHPLDKTLTLPQDLITHGGNVQLDAGSIDLNGHTIDTGAPTQAGNITLTGKTITIGGGARLLAQATTSGGTDGTILIEAHNQRAPGTGGTILENARVNLNKVNVTIGDATIAGGDVEILATASSAEFLHPSDFGDVPGLSSLLAKGFNDILKALSKTAKEIAVAYSESDATITIG